MISKIKVAFFICMSMAITANAQLKLPALSPSAKTIQTVGLTEIEISYSRPAVKDRIVFGDKGLVPFGEMWRTGANAATKITVSNTVTIGGQDLEKGDYALLTKPGKEAWVFFLYMYEGSSWTSYLEKEPVLMVNAESSLSGEKAESLEIRIQNITFNTADIIVAWDKTKATLPIKVKTQEQAMKNIARVFNGPSDFNYFQAALFLHESKTDLKTALNYIQKVTKNEKALFFQVYREALILSDLNRKKEALTAAKRSLKLSKTAKNNDFVRLNENLIKKLTK